MVIRHSSSVFLSSFLFSLATNYLHCKSTNHFAENSSKYVHNTAITPRNKTITCTRNISQQFLNMPSHSILCLLFIQIQKILVILAFDVCLRKYEMLECGKILCTPSKARMTNLLPLLCSYLNTFDQLIILPCTC